MPRLYIANESEILSGNVTDIYFVRTVEILKAHGLENTLVRVELHTYGLPKGYEWAVFAGLEEALKILENKPVNVYAMPEGTLFKPLEPLMVIEGPAKHIIPFETAVLGALRHSTSVATRAARIKKLAGNKQVLFFGLRSAHPAIAPMLDRAAYIGGCDAVSGVISRKYLGIEPKGTMPHILILIFGDPRSAWKAFDEVVSPEVPRIALADTMYDERVEALMAAETLKDKLFGVRFDTPSSRRGNMKLIVEEAKWTLKLHGYENVKIYVSGGVDECEIVELREVADGFGVGTSIAFPPSIDISADLIEKFVNGKWIPISKRGKIPGMKQVYRCRPGIKDFIVPWGAEPPVCPEGSKPKELLIKFLENGKLIRPLPTINEIRNYVLEQLEEIPEPKPTEECV